MSIMRGGEEIIIVALTMHSGLTEHIAVPVSLFPRCSSQGPYKHCISHKCYCLGQIFIVKIKATMCLRKMVPFRTQDQRLFDKYIHCMLEIMWKTYCRKSVTIRVTNVLEYTELKLYALEIMLSLNSTAYFCALKRKRKMKKMKKKDDNFPLCVLCCIKNINAQNAISTNYYFCNYFAILLRTGGFLVSFLSWQSLTLW